MTDQLPTVQIKGNPYVLVKDRVAHFNEKYPNGDIHTDLVSNEDGQVVMKAVVTPDTTKPERFFTGFSQAREADGMVNKTAALENAESSAVGRALAFMGIGVIESIASADELTKAIAPFVPAHTPDAQTKQILANAQARRTDNTYNEPSYNSTCKVCSEPATMKVGTKKNGEGWRGYFCSTGDRSHTKFEDVTPKAEPAPAQPEADDVDPESIPF